MTVPKLFVSNSTPPRPGLINQRDVVGFDEIAGSAFNVDDDKYLYKYYMESGQINRGTITVEGDTGFVRRDWNRSLRSLGRSAVSGYPPGVSRRRSRRPRRSCDPWTWMRTT